MTGEPSARPIPPSPLDQAKWDEAAIAFDLERLIFIRTSAEKWAESLTTLIGVFGVVAIIGGTDKLKDIDSAALRVLVIGLVIVAGIAASWSVLQSAKIARGGLPEDDTNWNGSRYREYVQTETKRAVRQLPRAQVAGVMAASLVFLVGIIGLIDATSPAASTSASTVVIINADGQMRCGALSTQDDGTVVLADQPELGEVQQALMVEEC